MSSRAQVAGQPLVALLAVLGGWIGGRTVTWEPPRLIRSAEAAEAADAPNPAKGTGGFVYDAMVGPQSRPGSERGEGWMEQPMGYGAPPSVPRWAEYTGTPLPMPQPGRRFSFWAPAGYAWRSSAAGFAPPAAPMPEGFGWNAERREPGLSDYSRLPSLAALAAQPAPPATVGGGASTVSASPSEPKRPKRWSGDAWTLLRRGGGGAFVAGGSPAVYGANQSGAVLRYRVDERSAYRPTAYLRTTSTLGQLPETSAALGLSVRPLPSVPVTAAVEARIVDRAGKQRYQPAAMVVTELPPFELPHGLRGEAYGQAGYVGGRFATLFADGQVRVDRPLFDLGAVHARLGTAAWGGIQKGARRLDVGPSATISMPLGRGTFGRVALDWRFRAFGNARPKSGPALTLSAGF